MTPARRKYELEKAGIEQQQIANEQGVSKAAISRLINNKGSKSDRLMKAIASALGKDHRLVFSEHYIKTEKSKHHITNKVNY